MSETISAENEEVKRKNSLVDIYEYALPRIRRIPRDGDPAVEWDHIFRQKPKAEDEK